MAKEGKTANPATAHLKSQKRAQIKKNKASVAAQRTERLAKRDPSRMERKIDALKALDTSGAGLREREREALRGLERDLALVRRARGGDEGRGREGSGKRARRDSGSETDPEVRAIPMPRDTPPPVPRRGREAGVEEVRAAQITYSSAPVMRDLKAAVTGARFAPAVVRRNVQKASGKAGLLEEEELERLERAGYTAGAGGVKPAGEVVGGESGKIPNATVEEVADED